MVEGLTLSIPAETVRRMDLRHEGGVTVGQIALFQLRFNLICLLFFLFF